MNRILTALDINYRHLRLRFTPTNDSLTTALSLLQITTIPPHVPLILLSVISCHILYFILHPIFDSRWRRNDIKLLKHKTKFAHIYTPLMPASPTIDASPELPPPHNSITVDDTKILNANVNSVTIPLCKTYTELSRQKKRNWNLHIVSSVHAMIVIIGSITSLIESSETTNESSDTMFTYSPIIAPYLAISTGHYLWKLLITLQNLSTFGLGAILQNLATWIIYFLAWKPFGQYDLIPWFMFTMETSTPILAMTWMMDRIPYFLGTWSQCLLNIGLFATYCLMKTTASIILSWQGIQSLFNAFMSKDTTIPLWYLIAYISAYMILNVLHIFWGYLLFASIKERVLLFMAKRERRIRREVKKKYAALQQQQKQQGLNHGRGSLALESEERMVLRRRESVMKA